MRGSLRQRAGAWELKVYVGRDPLTGRKRYASRTVRSGSRRAAEKALAAFVTEVGEKPVFPERNRTFGELLERWYEAASPDWSPNTAYQVRHVIDRRLHGLHGRQVRQLSVEDLDRFYAATRKRGGKAGRALSTATVNRIHGVVRLALQQGVRWGWLADNPALLARPGREHRTPISVPAANDVIRLLEAAGESDQELLTFLFLDAETGARRGELAALRLSDFGDDSVMISRALAIGPISEDALRLHDGHIWVGTKLRGRCPTAVIEKDNPKNNNSVRTLSLSPATMELVHLQEARLRDAAATIGVDYPDDGFLFPGSIDGTRPLRADTWTHRFARLREATGLDGIRLHDLRHFVATTLLTSGVDLSTVAGRLGHGSGGKTTLAIYSHFLRAPDQVASQLMANVLVGARPTNGDPGKVIPMRKRAKTKT
jgi:integrase